MPEIIVVAAALIAMAIDLVVLRQLPRSTRFAVAASICLHRLRRCHPAHSAHARTANLLDGTPVANPLAHLVQIALLGLTIFTLLLSVDATFTQHVGEFVLLIMVATAGTMFLVASQDLLVIFISLELLSLSLYILAAFDKRSLQSWEAAIKYFLFGGMSAAFLLFGFSLLYGLSNSTNLTRIAAAPSTARALNPSWSSPSSPPPLASASRSPPRPSTSGRPTSTRERPRPAPPLSPPAPRSPASSSSSRSRPRLRRRGRLPRCLTSCAAGSRLALIATLSMLLGNLVAIRQTSLRRLLAYSAVAHAGYMLLAHRRPHPAQPRLRCSTTSSPTRLATLGAFAVIAVRRGQTGSDQLAHFDGLGRRSTRALTRASLVFILSLAGIPPLAGFFGKFYLFVAVSLPRRVRSTCSGWWSSPSP